jgi:hypothetical protein
LEDSLLYHNFFFYKKQLDLISSESTADSRF